MEPHPYLVRDRRPTCVRPARRKTTARASAWRASAARPPSACWSTTPTPGPRFDRLYARNLETILALARAIDAVPVFVLQQMNAAAFENGTRARPWTPNVVDAAVPALMSHLNEILAATCAPPCVYAGGVANENHVTQDFVDEGRFGPTGAQKFAGALERSLRRDALANVRSERVRPVPVQVGEVDP